MQVYRGMNMGTAKPSIAEQAEVRHHLIDCIEPNQSFTVARFVEAADRIIANAAAQHVPLIATGGTPLYYKALFEGLFEGPDAASCASRTACRTIERRAGSAGSADADPAAALRIHLNDTRRLVRALEVFELTGRPISSFQTD